MEKEKITKNTENSNKQFAIIMIVSALILITIIVVTYFIMLGDNKKVFTNALNKTYKEISNTINSLDDKMPNEDMLNKPFNIEAKVDVSSELKELSFLNNYNFNLDMGFDYTKKILTLGAMINNKNNENIISANLNYIDNNIYLEVPKLLNKVILVNNDFDNTLFDFDSMALNTLNFDYINNLDILVKIAKDSLVNYVSKEDIITSKDTISINNKKHDVTSYSVILEGQKLDLLLDKLQNNLVNETNLINDLATLLNVKPSDVTDAIKDNSLDLDKLEVVVYREGILDNYVGGKIIINDDTLVVLNSNDYSFISLNDDITLTRDSETYTIDLSKLNSGLNTIIVKELNEKSYDISIDMLDYDAITVNVLEKDKNNSILTIKYGETSLKLDLTINYDSELSTINTSNAISIDNLNEDDQNTLLKNLMSIISEIPEISELLPN